MNRGNQTKRAPAKKKKEGWMSRFLKKWRSKKGMIWFWAIILSPFVIITLLVLLTSMGLFGRLPSFEELENPKSNLATEVYAEDGEVIGSFFIQNRSYVDYADLNDSVVAALISTEDMRFYTHSGIDFISLARVALKTVAMGDRGQGGGSTISQQLAKNLFPRDTVRNRNSVSKAGRLMVSKLKEWVTALKLEHNYTKEEIIAMYLNTVEYGSNSFGIRTAAQTFFNKEPADLTINEAAMLIGVVNAPTKYSPVRNPERALARRNTVVSRMEAGGFLTKHQRDSLVKMPIVLDYNPISHNQGIATYFREMIRMTLTSGRPTKKQYQTDWDYNLEVKRWDENPLYGWCVKNKKSNGENYNIYKDGLKIYTTLNSTLQRYAEQALLEHMRETLQPAMNAQVRASGRVFLDLNRDEIDQVMSRAIRYSDRYYQMEQAGKSKQEIDKSFGEPIKMKIFTYKGEVDTLMTPRDSVLHHKAILRASFMAMNPRTGEVKVYVGGPNQKYFQYDMVSQGKRQVGSTIKPFVYTFAIDHLGYTPCTPVPNLPVTIETATGVPWQPKEAGNNPDIYTGELKPLQWGLANSRNNFSAWIMKQAKQPAAVADFIHKMGIKSFIDPVYALSLGTPDVSVYEMVASYSTFVNEGVYTEPVFVTRIEDRYGNLLASFPVSTSDAISKQTAYTMVGMLQNVVNAGTAIRLRNLYGFTSEIAGKTGTSQENRDGWFMGVLPNLVTGVWVGGEDQSVHLRYGGEGSVVSLPIFARFLKKVYANPRLPIKETDQFLVPDNAVYYRCNPEDYMSGEMLQLIDSTAVVRPREGFFD